MAESLVFVQFPHPGSEHRPRDLVMAWNRGPHARKFLKASGEYLLNGQLRTGQLVFLGEWEPQSRVVKALSYGDGAYPRWLHEPYWELPRHRLHLQNTDPLVFGDAFLYSNCRQGKNRKLRELAPGSLIAFGSKYRREFVLDTVFVVGKEAEDFTVATAGEVRCDEWVRAVVFDRLRLSPKAEGQRFRLYRGTTYHDAPAGPFSFVPCLPYSGSDMAFRRPPLRLPRRWIEPNLAMGAKATESSSKEIDELWPEIVRQVEQAGLGLRVRLDPPPHDAAVAAERWGRGERCE